MSILFANESLDSARALIDAGPQIVDLHRNVIQKQPFLAVKTDPSAAFEIFEKITLRFAWDGSFPGCKSRVNPAYKSTPGSKMKV